MKILWITNTMFPPICEEIGLPTPVVGGWMYSSAENLLKLSPDIKLAVATVYTGSVLKKSILNHVTYYLLPLQGDNKNYNSNLEPYWREVAKDFNPDLAHLHGTEYGHGLAFQKACPGIETVVSIQGLTSIYARYYLAGIRAEDLTKLHTFHDIIKHSSILNGQKEFERRGNIEIEILKLTKNIIGRTKWDKTQTWAINPKANYHFCNETLRKPFYENKWEYRNCEPHTIFISQAGYAIKGLHQLLKAMPFILRECPDAKIIVAGSNIIDISSFKKFIRLTGYGKYIRKLIKKYSLNSHIVFTGPLNENQMCQQYLKANLFVCPSSIENSPNSLGEAQLLGMPCIASYVGGVPDMMRGFESWMYRFDEIEMLADLVIEVFKMEGNVCFENILAQKRHDKNQNSIQLIKIYNEILKN